jgi:hypothetical protein
LKGRGNHIGRSIINDGRALPASGRNKVEHVCGVDSQ